MMKKILVIDDNLVNLEYSSIILNTDFPDCLVLLSPSGRKGIEIAKRELPDTILLDILMPDLDGYEVCAILKNDQTTKHIPIIFLSAMNEISYKVRGLNKGADAYLTKPFNRVELKAQVEVMLRIKFAEDMLRNRNEKLELLIKKQTIKFENIEERYLKISEYALEYFWEVDREGKFSYVSSGVLPILGFLPEDIVGNRSLFEFCAVDENSEDNDFVNDVFQRHENFMANEIISIHKNGKKVWLTISGFPILDEKNNFAGYIGVNHDISRRRMAEEANRLNLEKINEYQLKLKKLYYELTLAEEKERRKIAQYLHDGLGQTISIAAIQLSSIAKLKLAPSVKRIVEESTELLHNAINESRILVYDLSPPILYELGLKAAIKWKLEQIKKKQGVASVLLYEEQSLLLKTDIKVLIFRMVCELLNNTIKHAHANLITVEISIDADQIKIRVSDNGKGFEFTQGKALSELGGFGLFSIKERLDMLQGSMEIDSEVPQGAKIILRIPI